MAAEIYHLREPQKIPLVMSPDETKRLLAVASSLKARILLSLGYGCGLRAGEVVRLKVKHIDSAQKIIRIEQSKGRKDRNVMLSPETLDLLRQWWKVRPSRHDAGTPLEERWLFPGRRPGKPMTTRQLNRLFHEAADAAGIKKSVTLHALRHSFATHLLERGTDIRIIQALLGHDKFDTTARYTRVATGMIASIESPLDLLSRASQEAQEEQERPAAGVTARGHVPSSAGGRGYLPRPRGGVAQSQCRPCQPRPDEGHAARSSAAARRRSAAMSRAARTRSALTPSSPTTAAATGIAPSVRALRHASGWPSARPSCCRCRTFMWCTRCRPRSRDIAYQNKAVIYDLLFKASAETTLTIAADPKHLGARIGFISVLHTWGSALTHHPHVHMVVPGGGLSLDGSSVDRVPTALSS